MSTPEVKLTDPMDMAAPWARLRAYVELTKPRIIELLLITTVPAMVVAAGGWPGTWLVFTTLIGGTLSAAGANTLNQVADRDIDQKMRRTRRRPVPTARIEPGPAIRFGVILGVAGFLWLWVTTNLLAAVLSTAGLLFYVFVYTLYLKRTSVQNIVIGGAAGAVPPLVGWAAVTGSLALPAWLMFAVVFYWTPPHFWALALRYQDDYAAAEVPMLPVVVGRKRTVDHIVVYTAILVGVSFMLATTPVVGALYLGSALVLGIGIFVAAWRLRSQPTGSMRFFGWSNIYLALLFVSMAVDSLV